MPEIQLPRFEYTAEQEANFAAKDAQESTESVNSDHLLTGPRQTGDIPLPAGGFERHGVSGDGMKYTRVHGERYKSAADFHRQAGVAQNYELEDQPAPEHRRRRVGQLLGKIARRSR